MAKAKSTTLSNSDEIRRMQKAKQKANARKGKAVAVKVFSFADLKADKRQNQQEIHQRQRAEKFGRLVDQRIHAALDAADQAGNLGVSIPETDDVSVQAKWELERWIAFNGGNQYASTVVSNVFRLIRLANAKAA